MLRKRLHSQSVTQQQKESSAMNGVMTEFKPAKLKVQPFEVFLAEIRRSPSTKHLTRDAASEIYREVMSHEVYVNDQYQVNVDKNPKHGFPTMTLWHLSIKRLDHNPIHDWRDLQAIKNAIAGPEFEAIELYPAESRVVDTANQFHLWVFMSEQSSKEPPQLPLGWWTRVVISDPDLGEAKQRPLNEES